MLPKIEGLFQINSYTMVNKKKIFLVQIQSIFQSLYLHKEY